jgi:hypothetical protein
MQRNGQKRDKIKSTGKYERKKVFFSLNFFGQKFLTWIFSKTFLWCFRSSSCRETAKKRDKKKSTGKDERKKGFFSLNFFGQKFLTWIFSKKFFMVFLNSPC